MVNMHHIISDGWSSGVMIREVAALYGAYVKGEPSGVERAGSAVRRLRGVAEGQT